MERIISAASAMGDADELSLHVFLKILIFRAHSGGCHGSIVCIGKRDSKKLQKRAFLINLTC